MILMVMITARIAGTARDKRSASAFTVVVLGVGRVEPPRDDRRGGWRYFISVSDWDGMCCDGAAA
jgi:hypothetical protein